MDRASAAGLPLGAPLPVCGVRALKLGKSGNPRHLQTLPSLPASPSRWAGGHTASLGWRRVEEEEGGGCSANPSPPTPAVDMGLPGQGLPSAEVSASHGNSHCSLLLSLAAPHAVLAMYLAVVAPHRVCDLQAIRLLPLPRRLHAAITLTTP